MPSYFLLSLLHCPPPSLLQGTSCAHPIRLGPFRFPQSGPGKLTTSSWPLCCHNKAALVTSAGDSLCSACPLGYSAGQAIAGLVLTTESHLNPLALPPNRVHTPARTNDPLIFFFVFWKAGSCRTLICLLLPPRLSYRLACGSGPLTPCPLPGQCLLVFGQIPVKHLCWVTFPVTQYLELLI